MSGNPFRGSKCERAARLREDARLLDDGMHPDLVRELHAEADKLEEEARTRAIQSAGDDHSPFQPDHGR